MAETKHTAATPGPWSATHNSWEVSSVYGPDNCLIAEVQIHPSVTENNQHELEPVKEANARLIAAAPAMLAALKYARSHGFVDQVDAAIAKAEATPMHELDKAGLEAAALVALARKNIPVDVQELLVQGNPMRDVAPGALFAAISNALASSTSAEVTEEQTPRVTEAMVARATTSLFNCVGDPLAKRNVRAALEASRAPVSQKEAVPVAWLVRDPMVAVAHQTKARALAPANTEWFYPAARKQHAHDFARTMGAECIPLYASPVPAPAGEPAVKAPKGWTYMPTYGEVSFSELVDAVAEAVYADRNCRPSSWEVDPARFIGHQIVPTINFNSLNRIVSAFIRSALHPTPTPVSEETCATCQGNGEIVTDWDTYLHGDDDDHATAECPDCNGIGKVSPTPVSAPVGVVEKWPEPGDKMQFLDRNGYDVELETARKVFTKGQVVTVKKFDLGGWCSSITFEELPGKWNSVMFARSPAVEGE